MNTKPAKRLPHVAILAMIGLLAHGLLATELSAQTQLVDAAKQNDVDRIKQLIDDSVDVADSIDVTLQQADGMTALHWTVFHDHADLTKAIIERGADVEVANRYGVRPLSLACQNGNVRIVKMLLEAGANAKTTLPGGETALMTAARTGRVGPLKALLEKGAEVNAKEAHGQTALIWATAEGHAAAVRLLIQEGAEFREPLKSGLTPLMIAARNGHSKVVGELLDAGADLHRVTKPEKQPNKGPQWGMSPLLLAVENGHFELAISLIEAGADPNDQRSGFTPLHALTWVRKPNRGDGPDGDPPPIGSGRLSSLSFVRELIRRGAKVDAQLESGGSIYGIKREGCTPFLLACSTADLPMMKLLVELGADTNHTNADGTTPIMVAAGIGTKAPTEEAGTEEEVLAALDFLLTQGGDVNVVDRRGNTAMHGAAYKNLPKAVEWLVLHRSQINVWNRKNRQGWTPVQIAEGFRPGNFKPSPATVAALHQAFRDEGLEPPPATPRDVLDKRKGYTPND